jgi:hypothetical protein
VHRAQRELLVGVDRAVDVVQTLADLGELPQEGTGSPRASAMVCLMGPAQQSPGLRRPPLQRSVPAGRFETLGPLHQSVAGQEMSAEVRVAHQLRRLATAGQGEMSVA